jgi:phosphate transport system protein
MVREAYQKALKDLQGEVLELGEMVSEAIKDAVEALKKRDIEKSRQIIKNDRLVNRKRFDIEEHCVLLIATQQPMAVDLRILTAILNVITDLERIGDHAEGIAKISLLIGDEPLVKPLVDVPMMAEIARSMLKRCLEAFTDRDAEKARLICNEDDKVDALYEQTYRELLLLMIENPKIIKGATYLMWVSHNLIADRVTNIAERVVFMVEGKMEELNVSKY